jgi:hypothetical protein
MKEFDQLPKSIKKAIRYIQQDAPVEQLEEIQKLIERAIQKRKLTNES